MTRFLPVFVAAFCAAAPAARAQDDPMKQAIGAQQRARAALSEAAVEQNLNEKLVELGRKFWLGARGQGLRFEDAVEAIALRNLARQDIGLPWQVIEADSTDRYAVTTRIREDRVRPWVALAGATSDAPAILAAIDGELVTRRALSPTGGIDPGCKYRVVFANNGEHDDRGHDDYARDYPCAPFLGGDLDSAVVSDLQRWAAETLRDAGR